MAVRPLNSIAGFSAGDPAITVIQANADITTINFTANGISNVGNVGNFKITGGSSGQALTTDGNGNLTFSTINTESNRAAPMPYLIPTGESYIVNDNFQGLYTQAITIDGELTVDGMLIEIQDSIQSSPTQVLFDTNGTATGNTGFTFLNYNGNLNVPGNLNITGSIIPGADDVYDLGSANARWRTGYFGGNTIYIGDGVITTSNNQIILETATGATIAVTGDANTSIIENGTSNITIDLNSDIRFGVGGTANVLVLTRNGIDYDGNLVVNGNIIANGGNVTGNVIIGNTANFSGNLTTGGVKTDNLYYANGSAWDLSNPGGSNTQVQFNNNGDFGASANFTFNSTTNNLTVTGNIVTNTGTYYGNAAGLTNIPGANIVGNITGNISNAVHASTANTVTDAAQPNITSLGTLTGLSINGNISVTGTANITDLAVSGNAVVGGNLQVNGNLIYINVEEFSVEDPIVNLNTGPNGVPPVANTGKDIGTALNYYDTQARIAFMGWDTSNAEFAFSSQSSITGEIVTFTTLGNVRAQTFKGNVEATTISGNLTTASQANITTVGTLGSLSVTGNVTPGNVSGANTIAGNYLVSNSGCVTIGGATIAVTGNNAGIFASLVDDINLGLVSNITMGGTTANVTVQGNLIANNNISVTGNVSANLVTGTLTTNAQPNVTSVGTLTSLNVTGNVTSNIANANTVITNSIASKRGNIAVTTDTIIDSFPVSQYRSAKYVVRSSSDIGYESLEVLLIHDDINSYITVYAAINDGGGNTVSITTGVSSGNVELRATGLSTNTKINLIGTYVPD
jgi:hypothetical protein